MVRYGVLGNQTEANGEATQGDTGPRVLDGGRFEYVCVCVCVCVRHTASPTNMAGPVETAQASHISLIAWGSCAPFFRVDL